MTARDRYPGAAWWAMPRTVSFPPSPNVRAQIAAMLDEIDRLEADTAAWPAPRAANRSCRYGALGCYDDYHDGPA